MRKRRRRLRRVRPRARSIRRRRPRRGRSGGAAGYSLPHLPSRNSRSVSRTSDARAMPRMSAGVVSAGDASVEPPRVPTARTPGVGLPCPPRREHPASPRRITPPPSPPPFNDDAVDPDISILVDVDVRRTMRLPPALTAVDAPDAPSASLAASNIRPLFAAFSEPSAPDAPRPNSLPERPEVYAAKIPPARTTAATGIATCVSVFSKNVAAGDPSSAAGSTAATSTVGASVRTTSSGPDCAPTIASPPPSPPSRFGSMRSSMSPSKYPSGSSATLSAMLPRSSELSVALNGNLVPGMVGSPTFSSTGSPMSPPPPAPIPPMSVSSCAAVRYPSGAPGALTPAPCCD
mmetsp:Transcript_5721/g.23647  ORF Transcript_5721/g.23647 Transcript_5721/m.23647 type:complete len:347 (-) Transcript_5721:2034-3074(-)